MNKKDFIISLMNGLREDIERLNVEVDKAHELNNDVWYILGKQDAYRNIINKLEKELKDES